MWICWNVVLARDKRRDAVYCSALTIKHISMFFASFEVANDCSFSFYLSSPMVIFIPQSCSV